MKFSLVNCFRLFLIAQVANVVFSWQAEVFVGVTKFQFVFCRFWIVSHCLVCSDCCYVVLSSFVFCKLFLRWPLLFDVFQFFLCSRLCSVVFGCWSPVSCLGLFWLLLLFTFVYQRATFRKLETLSKQPNTIDNDREHSKQQQTTWVLLKQQKTR